MKIALLCGGPSLERGISLNSARSVLDHLKNECIEILPVYFDCKKKAYLISEDQLYSNTPSDFDFKLQQTAKPLEESQLVNFLKSVDLTFPVMHGPFGEDGEIQHYLEKNDIPFVGSGSVSCKKAFDKYAANEMIKSMGFYTLPSAVLKIYHKDHQEIINNFFKDHKISRAIIKPASGGSSIGVFSVESPEEALEKASLLFSKRMDTRVVIEEFASGIEFTTIILQNRFGLPVAILPTEIETDYQENQIFDYRKKFLPTRQVTYHCPPRFEDKVIEKIQLQAEQLFSAFGMRDFARFDGWVLPDGNIWFSDFNPISGMEQNSFLFQQGSRIGLSHTELLKFIIKRTCQRYEINFPHNIAKPNLDRKQVNVLFGGRTSERQVSLMSGTNVWLKLRKSEKYDPKPFILDLDNQVWELPYALTLNHTVEEIVENCEHAKVDSDRLATLEEKVRMKLALDKDISTEPFFIPQKCSLREFIDKSSFVFIALHGGIGEDGTLQKKLTDSNIPYNGSGENTSRICIDKWETGNTISKSMLKNIRIIPRKLIGSKDLALNERGLRSLWRDLCKEFGAKTLIVKPKGDGCSSGIAHLNSPMELQRYLDIIRLGVQSIPPNTFKNQNETIELPFEPVKELLFEKYILSDTLRVKGNKLTYKPKTGIVEITIGVLEDGNELMVLNPSITIAEGEVLTVEEKFQGGTGINITPPPVNIISNLALGKIKKSIRELSIFLDIHGYARIDAFADVKTGELTIIEVNTLPGLTPSTVIYHQALAEPQKIRPLEFIEKIIGNKNY